MDDQITSAAPTPAQDEQHNDQTEPLWPEIRKDMTWSEHEALIRSLASSNNSWNDHEIPCDTCFEIPCKCPKCRWCGAKLVGQDCICWWAVSRNAIRAIGAQISAKLQHATGNLHHRLQGSLLLQAMEPLLESYYAIQHRQYIARCRKAVEAETDEPDGYVYVTKPDHIAHMVSQLANLPTDKPNLGFDMEANSLGHESPLSYLQIRDYHNDVSYLVDLLVLQKAAWSTTGTDGSTTLKTIFEDQARTKLIFDCRQDSACLYGQAGVKVQGVLDCQYLHMLTMDRHPKFRLGLVAAVKQMASLSEQELAEWIRTKTGQRPRGVWEKRPVPPECKAYAVGDVEILRAIYDTAETMLTEEALRVAGQWSAFEVGRTWCRAKDYTTKAGETWEDFESCWSRQLLKEGVEPNPAPRMMPDPY